MLFSLYFFYKHCKKLNITGASHVHFLQDKPWQFLNLRKIRPLLPLLDQGSSRAGFVPAPNLEPLTPVSTDKEPGLGKKKWVQITILSFKTDLSPFCVCPGQTVALLTVFIFPKVMLPDYTLLTFSPSTPVRQYIFKSGVHKNMTVSFTVICR